MNTTAGASRAVTFGFSTRRGVEAAIWGLVETVKLGRELGEEMPTIEAAIRALRDIADKWDANDTTETVFE